MSQTTPINSSSLTDGRARASQPDTGRPQRDVKRRFDDDYTYTLLDFMSRHAQSHNNDAFVTAQMSAKAGLKLFGGKGAEAIMKELGQLILMKVMSGVHAHKLTRDQKKSALKYLMFLKEKRCGRVKARGCTDGRKQRLYKDQGRNQLAHCQH